ncbi:hypothetical protein GLAREA_04005 [Glarea lozoyensis ATCC 20868]|uniref:Uncharacterized protein n=1 Tax=Glarea lozoyensis (strain ATCC 20868 / MF5171) TaxID=1116229 RepID=S3DXE4_GLAL2|nr:uncharacterized protein GLAREA_04005 [Glarea lozoyensis ATCC 20868]EPE31038.1 hypothetical protein GLAREA_04005 [Glarea lozoyensis ATCC 20868]
MPRRPVRLDLVKSTTPSTTSPLTAPLSPCSPQTPLTPLTPPLRLHLRTLIPSPPLSPHFLANQPDVPRPLLWRCHKCYRLYPLGVTRRCLEDGHVFCAMPGKGRQGCTVEFDYTAWAKFNIWRREHARKRKERGKARRQGTGLAHVSSTPAVSGNQSIWIEETPADQIMPELSENYQQWPVFRQWDCWMECNFPSECHGFRQWQARERRRMSRTNNYKPVPLVDEQWLEQEQLRAETEAQLKEFFEEEGQDSSSSDEIDSSSCYSATGDELEETTTDDKSLKVHPLFHSAFSFGKKKKAASPTATGKAAETQNVTGNVQIRDCDGLGEESHRHEYTRSKRRRSIEAIALGETPSACLSMDSPPSSPLKSEWDANEAIPAPVEEESWDDIGLSDDEETSEKQWLREIERKRIGEWVQLAGIEAVEAPKSPEMVEKIKVFGFPAKVADCQDGSSDGETIKPSDRTIQQTDEQRTKELDDLRDREMMEGLRAKSMFLRTFTVEEGEERFGDEADSYF